MAKINPYNPVNLKNIRARNEKKKKFRPSGVYGCEICWLTYIENLTGELGVCKICAMRCEHNDFQVQKPTEIEKFFQLDIESDKNELQRE